MARSALFCLFILAALIVAFPAPRRESVQPSALSGVGGEMDRALGGAPDKLDAPVRPLVGGAGVDPSGTPPSPSSGRHSPRPTSSLPGPSAGSGKPVTTAHAAQKRTVATRAPRKATQRPSAVPTAKSGVISRGLALTGVMSWFCLPGRSACTTGVDPGCACAAAGPRLRAALGDWRGRVVTVTVNGASARTILVDFCACPSRLLDGYAALWGGLGLPLSAGLVSVSVTW